MPLYKGFFIEPVFCDLIEPGVTEVYPFMTTFIGFDDEYSIVHENLNVEKNLTREYYKTEIQKHYEIEAIKFYNIFEYSYVFIEYQEGLKHYLDGAHILNKEVAKSLGIVGNKREVRALMEKEFEIMNQILRGSVYYLKITFPDKSKFFWYENLFIGENEKEIKELIIPVINKKIEQYV